MHIEVVEHTHQILVNQVPIEALISATALLVAVLSFFIAVKTSRESTRANILSFLPVISIDFDNTTDKVIIKNIGKGTAVDIVLDHFDNWSADKDFELFGKSRVEFERVNFLDSGVNYTVEHVVKGLEDTLGILTFTIFSKHTKKIDFVVKFKDISGKKYFTVVRVTQGKVTVKEFPRPKGIKTSLIIAKYRIIEKIHGIEYFVKVKYLKRKHDKDKLNTK